MKKFIIYSIFCLLSFNQVIAGIADEDTQQLLQKSRDAAKSLGSELKAALQASMKTNGPVAAISVCNVQAPAISKAISDKNSLFISRTALKYRNNNNKPDSWEKSVLEQFEKRKAAGEDISKMEYSELIQENDKKTFRYMKAIGTAEICLNCHGSTIAPPVAEKIDSLYPEDRATGFEKGDIRGAFSVKQALQ